MGLYKETIYYFEKRIINTIVFKNKYSEKKAIKRKRNLYNDVKWSDSELKCFNDYWIEYYGKPIKDYWHKLYQKVSGVFDERYFPEYLYSTELEWRINPKAYCDSLGDKNLLTVLFGDDDIYIPKTYISCANGTFQDGNKNIITKERALTILSDIGKAIIKPTVDSGSGYKVEIVELKDGIDRRNSNTVKDILSKYGSNFIVQELITPCEEIKKLSPNCLSTFRIMTYTTDAGIYTAPLSMRIGTGKSEVDNIHVGGLGIGVSNNGMMRKYAYRLGHGDNNEKFTAHPDSGIVFENYYIPKAQDMLEMAKKLHARIPQLGILSWDFTINDKQQVTLIEVNTDDQGVWFPQMVNGEPLFGDNTPYFLNLIRKKK